MAKERIELGPQQGLNVGRLVYGHPMKMRDLTDDHDNIVYEQDGVTPKKSLSFGVAMAKNGEQHWNQTPWGQLLWNTGLAQWPGGETNAQNFSWKVKDGDGFDGNGKSNAEKDGWAGHWIISFSTRWTIPCFHHAPGFPQIVNPDEMKTGDYVSVLADVTSNEATGTNTRGMYVTPKQVIFVRAGKEIVGAGFVDPNVAFAGVNFDLPQGAVIDNNIAPMGGQGQGVQGGPPPAAANPMGQQQPMQGVQANPMGQQQPMQQAQANPMGQQQVQLTPLAVQQGFTYESLIAAGMDDNSMRANGYIV